MKPISLLLVLCVLAGNVFAQDSSKVAVQDSTTETPHTKKFTYSFLGFVDFYYAYDFNKPPDHTRTSFEYNHNKHNQFALNLAVLRGQVAYNNRVRATLGVMAGSYVVANMGAEPVPLRYLYEANFGVRVVKNLWIDAGIFTSHLGGEGLISKDQWALTRSIIAENTPYYLTGIKATWQINDNWTVLVVGCQGWQNMRETPGNTNKAVGTQLTFSPNKNVSLNYNTFFGNEKTDSAKQYRFHNNLYGVFQLTDKLGLMTGFDICIEQKPGQHGYNLLYAPIATIRYVFDPRFAIALRGEYYSDGGGIMVPTATIHGFQTAGASINFDYSPFDFVSLRIEGRMFNSQDKIFVKDGKPTNWDGFITTSLAVMF